jgi:hypothetical protein
MRDAGEAGQIFFEALIGREADPGWSPSSKVGESGAPADALHFFQGGAGAVGGADQRAHAGAGDEVYGNICGQQGAQYADMGDAASESAGEREAHARPGRVGIFAAIRESAELVRGYA